MANAEFIFPLTMPVIGQTGTAPIDGTAVAHLGLDYAGIVYRTTGAAARTVTVDFGSDVEIDRLMLFGLKGFPIAATMRVSCSTNAQGATYAAFASATVPVLAGDQRLVNGYGVGYLAFPGAPAARYWRIEFGALANATVEISRLVLGKALILNRNFSFGGSFGFRSTGSFELSARGVIIRRRGKRLRTVGISFPHTRREEVEAKVAPLLETVGDTETIALIIDPAAHAMRERRCYFGVLAGDLGTTWRNAAGWEWRADLVSLF